TRFSRDWSSDVCSSDLTEGFMSIFNQNPSRSSGHQLHFEERQVLNLLFICKPIKVDREQIMIGIEMMIGPMKVNNIRQFLQWVREGQTLPLSPSFTYDSSLHCFSIETDLVIRELRSEEHTSELQSREKLVCRLLLE